MKKILIIGANGKVGKLLTEKLQANPYFTPIALIRNEEQQAFFEQKNILTRLGNLEEGTEQLTQALQGMDAVVFTAGSGGATGHDKTLTVDLDGAVKSMEAAVSAKVKRFVMVSALKADDRQVWDSTGLKPYYIAKHYADQILRSMDLDHSIVRPGLLLDEKGTGRVTTEDPASRKGIPREDVAEIIVEVLQHDNTIGATIEVNGGETPIQEVVSRI